MKLSSGCVSDDQNLCAHKINNKLNDLYEIIIKELKQEQQALIDRFCAEENSINIDEIKLKLKEFQVRIDAIESEFIIKNSITRREKRLEIINENLIKKLKICEIRNESYKKIIEVYENQNAELDYDELEENVSYYEKKEDQTLIDTQNLGIKRCISTESTNSDIICKRLKLETIDEDFEIEVNEIDYATQLNTHDVVRRLAKFLKDIDISRSYFARQVLHVSREYLIEIMRHPIVWSKLFTRKGKRAYIQINKVLNDKTLRDEVLHNFNAFIRNENIKNELKKESSSPTLSEVNKKFELRSPDIYPAPKFDYRRLTSVDTVQELCHENRNNEERTNSETVETNKEFCVPKPQDNFCENLNENENNKNESIITDNGRHCENMELEPIINYTDNTNQSTHFEGSIKDNSENSKLIEDQQLESVNGQVNNQNQNEIVNNNVSENIEDSQNNEVFSINRKLSEDDELTDVNSERSESPLPDLNDPSYQEIGETSHLINELDDMDEVFIRFQNAKLIPIEYEEPERYYVIPFDVDSDNE